MMTELQLFLGMPVDDNMIVRLKASKDYKRYLSPDSDYLTEVNGEHGCFIGKKIAQSIDQESLQNIQANIYSLLSKLAPDFPFKTIPLVLFPHE